MVTGATIDQVLPARETLNMGIGEHRYTKQQKGMHVEQAYEMNYAVACQAIFRHVALLLLLAPTTEVGLERATAMG